MHSRIWKSILFAALLAVILPSISIQCAFGQSQSINGTIRGTVMDTTGAVLPGVTITITNTAISSSKEKQTKLTAQTLMEIL